MEEVAAVVSARHRGHRAYYLAARQGERLTHPFAAGRLSPQILHAVKNQGDTMTMPSDDKPFLHELEVEVEADLDLVASAGEPTGSPAEWQYDPTDIEREEAGLRNLLGAVEALEDRRD